jgi:hypothetical protein
MKRFFVQEVDKLSNTKAFLKDSKLFDAPEQKHIYFKPTETILFIKFYEVS